MTLTLWRGARFLGELQRRAPSLYQPPRRPGRPPTVSAILIPAPQSSSLTSVYQVRLSILPAAPVMQHPIEPDVVAERGSRGANRSSAGGPVALQPMSAEEARGLPCGEQLRICADNGDDVPTLSIMLLETRFDEAPHADALRAVPPQAIVDGSVWTVFAALEVAPRNVAAARMSSRPPGGIKFEL